MTENKRDGALFTRLLSATSLRANEILSVPGSSARIRAVSDDGFNEIERLELSPQVDDQLVAVALRLSGSRHSAGQPLVARMSQYFYIPASKMSVEAVRKTIWSENDRSGLPIDLAEQAVTRLEERLVREKRTRFSELRAYSTLYSQLWCDPRIGAEISTRRIMLAMVTSLAARAEVDAGGPVHKEHLPHKIVEAIRLQR